MRTHWQEEVVTQKNLLMSKAYHNNAD